MWILIIIWIIGGLSLALHIFVWYCEREDRIRESFQFMDMLYGKACQESEAYQKMKKKYGKPE